VVDPPHPGEQSQSGQQKRGRPSKFGNVHYAGIDEIYSVIDNVQVLHDCLLNTQSTMAFFWSDDLSVKFDREGFVAARVARRR
jgi:hypothetical protein